MIEIDDSEAVEKSHVELYQLLCEHFDDKLSSPEKGMLTRPCNRKFRGGRECDTKAQMTCLTP